MFSRDGQNQNYLMRAWRSTAPTDQPVRIDPSTNRLIVIETDHQEIHEGESFFLSGVTDLSINNVIDLQIVAPNTTQWAHFIFKFETESETSWFFYENVSIQVAGTALTELNRNRNSATAATLAVSSILNTSVADANADTVVAGATTLYTGISGAGKDAGSASHEIEVILKQNTAYSMRFIATAAGYVNWFLNWYEHTNII